MPETIIKFNINQCVRVKLTDFGRRIHRQRFRELNARLPLRANLKYAPPEEDADGWSVWQLWMLMECFGSHCLLGCENPFECDIELVTTKNA